MVIEFRCTKCGSLLRTPDETAGKMAKCPTCENVLPIPQTSTAGGPPPVQPPGGNPFAAPAAPNFPPASDNPYQSPAAAPPGAAIDYSAAGQVPITPSPLEVGEVMRRSWTIFKANAGMCIVGAIVVLVVQYAVQIASNLVVLPLGIAMPDQQLLLAVAQIASVFAVQVFSCWIALGQMRFFMRIARGGEPEIGDLFTGSMGFLANLTAMIIYMVAVTALMLVCIGPGIAIGFATGDQTVGMVVGIMGGLIAFVVLLYLVLTYGQFMYAIADRNVSAMESFRISSAIMSGNRMSLFVLGILISLVALLGLLACCVGMLVAIPYGWLCLTVAYLMMSGQPTAGGPPTA